jgi:hypothetical protein
VRLGPPQVERSKAESSIGAAIAPCPRKSGRRAGLLLPDALEVIERGIRTWRRMTANVQGSPRKNDPLSGSTVVSQFDLLTPILWRATCYESILKRSCHWPLLDSQLQFVLLA